LNVEYVVKPPITPVVRMARASLEMSSVAPLTCMMNASRHDPAVLTISVPKGNADPNAAAPHNAVR
jgi:hypothetical protein